MLKITIVPLFLLLSIVVFAQFPTKGFNLDNPTFLDSTIADYEVFFTSEVHWDTKNSHRKKKMIVYLSDRNSLDVIVVERSYDFGHWVNYFLETGDSLFLKEYLSNASFFNTRNGVVYDDEYEFYRWLRKFEIENNLGIKVIGIDMASFWHGKPILWSFLKFIDQNPNLQKPLETSIAKAKNLILEDNLSTRAILKWHHKLESTTNDLDISDETFSNYLYNLQQSVKWSKGHNIDYRENEIASNFIKYINKGQKVYGQYGMGHILLQPEKLLRGKPFKIFTPKTYISFVSILNKKEEYRGKILSIGLVCFNCDRFDDYPGPDLFSPFVNQEDFNRLKSKFLKLPSGTFIDLRETNEKAKENCQLLLVEFD